MTIQDAQDQVDQWIKSYGIRYFHELTNLGILVEEVGELSRHMVRTYGEQSYKREEDALLAKDHIRDEMADILWVLICLANQTGIDLTAAFQATIHKKTQRDHLRHRENPKLNPGHTGDQAGTIM